jgi:hypothetical protein
MSHSSMKKTRLVAVMLCPLCFSQNLQDFRHIQTKASVHLCGHCDLIFKEPVDHLSWSLQKERYDTHQNQIGDVGYVKFLRQMVHPLMERLRGENLKQQIQCLDWGAGPGPVLGDLLRLEGLAVEIYDPVYQPVLPGGKFDVITCTEVIEHFQNPLQSFKEIDQRLKPLGLLAGLTSLHLGPKHFETWWYARDQTHVVFYSEKTFQWIAERFQYSVLHLSSPVFLLRKNLQKNP